MLVMDARITDNMFCSMSKMQTKFSGLQKKNYACLPLQEELVLKLLPFMMFAENQLNLSNKK